MLYCAALFLGLRYQPKYALTNPNNLECIPLTDRYEIKTKRPFKLNNLVRTDCSVRHFNKNKYQNDIIITLIYLLH